MTKTVYGVLSRVFSVVLILVGAAAIFGSNFAHSYVTEQLEQENLTMPSEEGVNALEDQESQDKLRPYIDEPMTTGNQAEAFANNYIWQHMMASSDGKGYQEVSGEFNAMAAELSDEEKATNEEFQALDGLRDSLFMGDTLRGMLLNAYGWWLVGTIALWVGIGAIVVGVILAGVGFGPLRAKKTEGKAAAVAAESGSSKE
ncbi:MAG: hypothetical protein ACTHW1_01255 [Ancrocorticia sp.]|uniref:hypothetical protein n=1 Tax=Ancrocorticia sp. TaxID=2593684 RepID=UPI003F8DADBF